MSGSDNDMLKLWSATGNADAFAELVRRYAPLVYSAALRVLRNATDAEDVAQQCFLELAQRPPAIRNTLAGWLHRLATHRALNHLRGEKRRAEREAAYEARRAAVDGETWEPIAEAVDEAIAALTPGIHEVITRRFFLGESPEEVARALGIAERTVRHRQQQGVEAIRESLKRRGLITGVGLSALLAANLSAGAACLPDSLNVKLGQLALSGIRPAPATGLGWALAPPPMTTVLGVAACAVVAGAIMLTTLTRSNPERDFDQSTAQLRADSVAQASGVEASLVATALAASGDNSGNDTSQVPQITLRVTDLEGAPVAGAALVVGGLDETIARTNSEGYAALAAPLSPSHYLRLRADGHIEQIWRALSRLLHAPVRVESEMFVEGMNTLQVNAADGKPLEGVEVIRKDDGQVVGRTDATDTISVPDDSLLLRHPEYGEQALNDLPAGSRDGAGLVAYLERVATLNVVATVNGVPVEGAVITPTNGARADTSRPEGTGTRFVGLVPGKQYAFNARLDRDGDVPLIGYAFVSALPGDERTLALELTPPPSIVEGTVRWESGLPVAAQTVLVSAPIGDLTVEVTTGADGRFRAPLFPDLNNLDLKGFPANARLKERVDLRGSVRTPVVYADLVLTQIVGAPGSNGSPVEQTILLKFTKERPDQLALIETVNSSGYCRYIISTPEDFLLRVSRPPGELIVVDEEQGVAGILGGPTTDSPGADTVLINVPVGTVSGTIRDQHGALVPHAVAHLSWTDWPSLSVQSDREGRFSAWPVPLHREFTIRHGMWGRYFGSNAQHTPTKPHEEITVTLARPDTPVSGRVVYSDGSPVPRGSVHCESGKDRFNATFAIKEGRFSGFLVPDTWKFIATDGILQSHEVDFSIPRGEITLAFDVTPTIPDTTVTTRLQEIDNMMKQLGLVFKMFANEAEKEEFPPLSRTFGRLFPETEVIYPEYVVDGNLLSQMYGAGEEKFCYLGYTIEDEATALTFLDAYETIGPEAMQGDDLTIDSESDDTEPTILHRIRESEEFSGRESTLPVLWQVPDPERDTGGWVLFMDGHTEWRDYPGEFPMTEAVIGRIRELQGEAAE